MAMSELDGAPEEDRLDRPRRPRRSGQVLGQWMIIAGVLARRRGLVRQLPVAARASRVWNLFGDPRLVRADRMPAADFGIVIVGRGARAGRRGNPVSVYMPRLVRMALIAVQVLLVAGAAHAQLRMPLVAFLIHGTETGDHARLEALRDGVRELGYVEGNLKTAKALGLTIQSSLLQRGPGDRVMDRAGAQLIESCVSNGKE